MFGPRATEAPLLTGAEINRLINAARAAGDPTRSPSPSRGRPGEQPASITGASTDFADVRPYRVGDDPRRIDWRATARSRVPLVRTYHAEFDRSLCLLIDRRAAMRFGTRTRLKVTQAVRMALWLGGQEARAGHAIAAVLLDSPCHWMPPQRGISGLLRLAELAVAPCPPIDPSPSEPAWGKILAGLRQRLPQGGRLILLSDFAGLGGEDARALNALGRHCATTAIRVVDPLEVHPPAVGGLQLRWGALTQVLDGAPTDSTTQMARDQQAWSESLAGMLRRAGMAYRVLPVEQDELAELGQGIG